MLTGKNVLFNKPFSKKRVLAPSSPKIIKLTSSIYRLLFLCFLLLSVSIAIYVVSRFHPVLQIFNIPIAIGLIWVVVLFVFGDALRRHFGFRATVNQDGVRVSNLSLSGNWQSQPIALTGIETIEVTQSSLGRALDYANVFLIGANQRLLLKNIDNPFDIAVQLDDMRDHSFEMAGKAAPICRYRLNRKNLSTLSVRSSLDLSKRPILQKRNLASTGPATVQQKHSARL